MKQKWLDKLFNFTKKHFYGIGAVFALLVLFMVGTLLWHGAKGSKTTEERTVSEITDDYGNIESENSTKTEDEVLYAVYGSSESASKEEKEVLKDVKENTNTLLESLTKVSLPTTSSTKGNSATDEAIAVKEDLYALGIVKVHIIQTYEEDRIQEELLRDVSGVQFNKGADYIDTLNSSLYDWNIRLSDEENEFDLGMHILQDIGFDIDLNEGLYRGSSTFGLEEAGGTITQYEYEFPEMPKALTDYLETLALSKEDILSLNAGFSVRKTSEEVAGFNNMYYTVEYEKDGKHYTDITAYYMTIDNADALGDAFLLHEEEEHTHTHE